MKRILSILLILISINVFGQEKETTYKNYLVAGIECYDGLNNFDDMIKIFSFKKINQDKLYIKNGFSIKLYDFIYTNFSGLNKYPFKINTGITFFYTQNSHIISIPVNLKTDLRLTNRIWVTANIGGRYFTKANEEFNNKIFLEYGGGIVIVIDPTWQLQIGYSVIQNLSFIHIDIPLIPIGPLIKWFKIKD